MAPKAKQAARRAKAKAKTKAGDNRVDSVRSVRKIRPRMVPRLVMVKFYSALSGEPLAYNSKVKPNSKVGALFVRLCRAIGCAIEETRLVFGGKHLNNKTSLARAGIRGTAQIGVVVAQPSFTCGGSGGA